MHVIIVHYACDTPVTRSAGPCDCPDLPGRSPAALQAPTDQFNKYLSDGAVAAIGLDGQPLANPSGLDCNAKVSVPVAIYKSGVARPS